MNGRPLFVAFGIPVRFDPFFLIGAFLFYSWAGGGTAGMYTVVAMVVFVLIHEFGHALTARHFGAEATITVSFLGGYASYVPTRRHSSLDQILISAAGPVTQFVAAVPVLWLVASRYETAYLGNDVAALHNAEALMNAVLWAGIFLAYLNLAPFWPLDGGHIVQQILVDRFGQRAIRPFLIFSIAGAGLMGIMSMLVRAKVIQQPFGNWTAPNWGPFPLRLILTQLVQMPSTLLGGTIFIPLIIAVGSWQRLATLGRVNPVLAANAPSARELRHEDALRAARAAERSSWETGHLASFPSGWEPSPWVRAHVDLLAGRHDQAAADLAALGSSGTRRWVVDNLDRPEIGHLLTLVPSSASDSLPVIEARVHHGSAEDLVAAATTRFVDEQTAEPLYLGAAGLAERSLDDEAMAWLQRAVAVMPDPHRLGTDRGFHRLHRRSDFQQLLGQAERSAGTAR